MIITRIEEIDAKKRKVYIDGDFEFLLYSNEIRRFHLEEQMLLEQNVYEELRSMVHRRAKLKTMDWLKRSDRTESELVQKLKRTNFNEESIQVAIDYVKSYGYINDERYAENYIRLKKNQKSKRALQYDLSNKGIAKELIDRCMQEEFSFEDEEDAILKLVQKKINGIEELTPEKAQKLIASICRKGFSYEMVKKIIRNHLEN